MCRFFANEQMPLIRHSGPPLLRTFSYRRYLCNINQTGIGTPARQERRALLSRKVQSRRNRRISVAGSLSSNQFSRQSVNIGITTIMASTRYGGVKRVGIMARIGEHLVEVLEMLDQPSRHEDVRRKLEEMKTFVNSVNPYSIDRSTPLSPQLDQIMEDTSTLNLTKLSEEGKFMRNVGNGELSMISFPGQVQLLQFLVRKLNAKNILEIGSFTGYGTCGMAEVMTPGSKVTGIEIEPFYCDVIEKRARKYNLNVEVKQGKAVDVLKSLAKDGQQYDFIYMDCVKVEYPEYYQIIMDNRMLSLNGLIVCDNVLWNGLAITRSDTNGKALDDFTRNLSQDKRVITVMLPCHDGTLLVQHRHDKE